MRKFTLISLNIICTILISLVFAISIAWYSGVLETYQDLYQSFSVQPSILFSTVYPYAHLAWIVPLVDAMLLILFALIPKYQQWLWGLLILTSFQLIFMGVTMYSTNVLNHGWN